MSKQFILTAVDPEDGTYHSSYLMEHANRGEAGLRQDYAVMLELAQLDAPEEWDIGGVVASMSRLGWKIASAPEVKVTY